MAFGTPSDTLQDFTNNEEAYKIWYATAIVETLYRKSPMFEKLKKKSIATGGKEYREPIALRNPNAVGARGEGESLPEGRAAQYVNSVITAKYNYCRIAASNVAEAHSASSKGAWARVKTEQLKRASMDFAENIERQLWGEGTGILCECLGTPVDNGDDNYTVTVVGYGDTANYTGHLLHDIRYAIEPNMWLVWGTTAELGGASAAGAGYVTDVAADGSSFSVTKTAGAAPGDDDLFVRGDGVASGSHSYNSEMMGVTGVFSDADGTFQGITNSGGDQPIDEWRAKQFENPDAAGEERPIDEIQMQAIVDYVDYETTGDCEMIALHPVTRRAYAEALKQRNGERCMPTKVKGGYDRSYLTFHASGRDLPLVECRHAPLRRMFFFGADSMKLYMVKGFHWDESNGGMWKWDGQTDALTGFGKMYCNSGTSNRKACASYDDLAVENL